MSAGGKGYACSLPLDRGGGGRGCKLKTDNPVWDIALTVTSHRGLGLLFTEMVSDWCGRMAH